MVNLITFLSKYKSSLTLFIGNHTKNVSNFQNFRQRHAVVSSTRKQKISLYIFKHFFTLLIRNCPKSLPVFEKDWDLPLILFFEITIKSNKSTGIAFESQRRLFFQHFINKNFTKKRFLLIITIKCVL